MYVHRERKLIYLAHPRTGSQATAAALERIGFESQGNHHSSRPLPGVWHTITTVRNPWDWAASWRFRWLRRARSERTWEEEQLEAWQTEPWGPGRWEKAINLGYRDPSWASGILFPYVGPSDQVWRYETLEEGVRELGAELERVGDNEWRPGPEYQHLFTETARDWIARLWAPEIEALGYEF